WRRIYMRHVEIGDGLRQLLGDRDIHPADIHSASKHGSACNRTSESKAGADDAVHHPLVIDAKSVCADLDVGRHAGCGVDIDAAAGPDCSAFRRLGLALFDYDPL